MRKFVSYFLLKKYRYIGESAYFFRYGEPRVTARFSYVRKALCTWPLFHCASAAKPKIFTS